VDFVKICNVYVGKIIIKAAKRILNSDKICRSCSDLNFGVTFLEHSVLYEVQNVEKQQRSQYGLMTNYVKFMQQMTLLLPEGNCLQLLLTVVHLPDKKTTG